MFFNLRRDGFSVPEILFVLGILLLLMGIVTVVIAPGRQLVEANNAERRDAVTVLSNALHQYEADHNGELPSSIETSAKEICKSGVSTSICVSGVDLSSLSKIHVYLAAIPIDPSAVSSAWGTGYFVSKTTGASPAVTVSAPNTQDAVAISVTR